MVHFLVQERHGLNPCVVGLRFAFLFLLRLLNLLLGLLILSGFQILCIMVQGSLSIGMTCEILDGLHIVPGEDPVCNASMPEDMRGEVLSCRERRFGFFPHDTERAMAQWLAVPMKHAGAVSLCPELEEHGTEFSAEWDLPIAA